MNQFEDKYHDHTVYERRLHDEASRIFTLEIQAKPLIEKAHEKGKGEGIQEGKREGIQEGKREGIQEGKREGVLNLHADGFDIPKISKWMNLTEEEVRKIIENP